MDKETSLSAWILHEDGFELTLKQISPDQIRAFYLARGFSKKIANDIANSCMFQTIAKNTMKHDINKNMIETITVLQVAWQVKTATGIRGIKLKKTWDKEWDEDEVNSAARIAYRWATFPTKQSFEPSDYNWGMTCFDLKPGSEFDLRVYWKHGDQKKSTWINSLKCALDE